MKNSVDLPRAHQDYTVLHLSMHKLWRIESLCLLFLSAFVLYLSTVSGSFEFVDGSEMMGAAYSLGVPHPPGYPFYTLVLKLASFVPIGAPSFRMNILGPLFGALTIILLAVLAENIDNPIGALMIALTVLLAPVFWFQTANVKGALYIGLTSLVLAAFIALCGKVRLPILGLLAGFSMGFQFQGGLLMGLALAVGLVVDRDTRQRINPRSAAFSFIFAALGLGLYLSLPIMASSSSPFVWGSWNRFTGIIEIAKWGLKTSAVEHRGFGLDGNYPYAGLVCVLVAISIVGNILGLLSARNRCLHGAALILTLGVFLVLLPLDVMVPYFQRCLPLFACAVAAFVGVFSWWSSGRFRAYSSLFTSVVSFLGLSATLISLLRSSPADMSRLYVADDLSRNMISLMPRGRAVFLSFGDYVCDAIVYRQLVYGDRSDVPVLRMNMAALSVYGDYLNSMKKRFPWLCLPSADHSGKCSLDSLSSAVINAQPPGIPVYADPSFATIAPVLRHTLSGNFGANGIYGRMTGTADESFSLKRVMRMRFRGQYDAYWDRDRFTRYIYLVYASGIRLALRERFHAGRKDAVYSKAERAIVYLMSRYNGYSRS